MKDETLDFFVDKDQTESFFITLTDFETGEDRDFEVVAEATLDGKRYFAMIPPDDKSGDCIVLSAREENGELVFETILDDEEYEKVEDYFNDLLFGATDYDN